MSGLSCPACSFARQVWRLSDGQVQVRAADLESRAPQAAVPDLPNDASSPSPVAAFRVIGPAGPGSVCIWCYRAEGEVLKIASGEAGSKAETLHEGCEHRERDFYPTPFAAVPPLIPHLRGVASALPPGATTPHRRNPGKQSENGHDDR